MKTIPANEFQEQCLQVLDEVAGSRLEVVVTKDGKPLARVVPVEEPALFGRMKGSVRILGDIVGPTGEEWDPHLPE